MPQSLYVMMGKPPTKTGAVRLNKTQSAVVRRFISGKKPPSSVTKRTKARTAQRARNITRRKKKKKKK